jgi:hypothetical protein
MIRGDRHWTAYVFHLLLLAAGPAIGVHQPLYRRWQREGSLTRSASWDSPDLESLLRSQKESTAHCLELIDEALSDPKEIVVARHCLRLFQMAFIRNQQLRLDNQDEVDSRSLSPLLDPAVLRLEPGVLDYEAESWVRGAEEGLKQLEAGLAAQRKGASSQPAASRSAESALPSEAPPVGPIRRLARRLFRR